MTAHPAILAKLAAARAAGAGRLADPLEHLAWVETGAPFTRAGITGFLDGIPSDLGHADPSEVAAILDRLEAEPAPDPVPLFMKTRGRRARHAMGEYYTPSWLVEHVLDRARFTGATDERLLDPMCGAGAFLAAAIGRARRSRPGATAGELAGLVAGFDVSPVAVLMTRAACLHALADRLGRGPVRVDARIADAILDAPPDPAWDIVAGNPPWVGWESLPREYRKRSNPLWKHHGLFPDGGGRSSMQVMLGRGRKDLSMLATYIAADRFLRPGGRLVFVITQSVFKSVGAGAGFRRFVLGDGTPLGVEQVDAFSYREVFPGASTRTAVLTLRKGEPTRYPVPYVVIGRGTEHSPPGWAEPVDPRDPGSAWVTGPRETIESTRRLLGPSAYRARAGAYSGGANGVYWVRREAGSDRVTNIAESGKREIPRVTARVEDDLLFPLLRASGVRRFLAQPADWILLPQDPAARRGIVPLVMTERFPLALAYLERFRDTLALRRDRGTRSLVDQGAPFYSLFSVSVETLSDWKVVWPRIASRLEAAAVGPHEGRPVIPQETCTFVACDGRDEAAYLAGVLNSTAVNEAARAFGQTGGKGFGGPHLLRHIAIPRYDRGNPAHRALAAIVVERGAALGQDVLDRAAQPVWSVAV